MYVRSFSHPSPQLPIDGCAAADAGAAELDCVGSKKGEEKMFRKVACLLTLSLVLTAVIGVAEDSDKEKAAVASAEKWLGLVDGGKYGESW